MHRLDYHGPQGQRLAQALQVTVHRRRRRLRVEVVGQASVYLSHG
jgi:hypothetical protein